MTHPRPPAPDDPRRAEASDTGPEPAASPGAALELRASGIAKSFNDRAVIAGVDLDVRRGEMLAIVGGSGCGKTVLMHILAGLMPPDAGVVRAADHSAPASPLVDLASLDGDGLDRVRRFWAVVFQRNALFSGTVMENIALLLREHEQDISEDAIRDRARTALKAAALDVDDVLFKDRDQLSGGMAKRVAIARAIALDPALIFYDEPTTGLDPVISGQIHELIWSTHESRRGGNTPRTSLIVTHDKDLLRRLHPRVVMLHQGRICFDGPYDTFGRTDCAPAIEYLRAMPVLHART